MEGHLRGDGEVHLRYNADLVLDTLSPSTGGSSFSFMLACPKRLCWSLSIVLLERECNSKGRS